MKVMIVLNIPDSWKIEDCDVFRCRIENRELKQVMEYYPVFLKNIPKPIRFPINTHDNDGYKIMYANGYNECLCDILGG